MHILTHILFPGRSPRNIPAITVDGENCDGRKYSTSSTASKTSQLASAGMRNNVLFFPRMVPETQRPWYDSGFRACPRTVCHRPLLGQHSRSKVSALPEAGRLSKPTSASKSYKNAPRAARCTAGFVPPLESPLE